MGREADVSPLRAGIAVRQRMIGTLTAVRRALQEFLVRCGFVRENKPAGALDPHEKISVFLHLAWLSCLLATALNSWGTGMQFMIWVFGNSLDIRALFLAMVSSMTCALLFVYEALVGAGEISYHNTSNQFLLILYPHTNRGVLLWLLGLMVFGLGTMVEYDYHFRMFTLQFYLAGILLLFSGSVYIAKGNEAPQTLNLLTKKDS